MIVRHDRIVRQSPLTMNHTYTNMHASESMGSVTRSLTIEQIVGSRRLAVSSCRRRALRPPLVLYYRVPINGQPITDNGHLPTTEITPPKGLGNSRVNLGAKRRRLKSD